MIAITDNLLWKLMGVADPRDDFICKMLSNSVSSGSSFTSATAINVSAVFQ